MAYKSKLRAFVDGDTLSNTWTSANGYTYPKAKDAVSAWKIVKMMKKNIREMVKKLFDKEDANRYKIAQLYELEEFSKR